MGKEIKRSWPPPVCFQCKKKPAVNMGFCWDCIMEETKEGREDINNLSTGYSQKDIKTGVDTGFKKD